MFKLVAVGGKLRGQSFELQEGDNVVGRSHDCDVQVQAEGVSKKHFKITVNGTNCYVQDMGSSNGTFVNGKLVKKMTVENKYQIAIPNIIFQVVYVREKIVKKEAEFKEAKVDYNYDQKEPMPNDFIGKMRYQFKHKLMQVLYSFNEQYEWNIMLGILVFLFICLNISVSIGPVLTKANAQLEKEIKGRATQYVEEVARYNAIHMSRGEFQKIDTKYLDDYAGGDDLESYELVDMERRIVRPVAKIDTYSNDEVSIEAMNWFKSNRNYGDIYYDLEFGSDEVGVAKALMVHNSKTGALEPVGVISMRFRPQTLRNQLVSNSTSYLEALVWSSIIGVFFFGFIYYITIKPIEQMRVQTVNARAKRVKELTSDYLFSEIAPIREEINGMLQSISELDGDEDSEMMIDEDDSTYVEALLEIGKGIDCGYIVLNSDRLIQASNEKTYDLIGLREDFAKDKDLTESIEQDGLADEILVLCDDSSNQDGGHCTVEYELSGENYMINVKAMLGRTRIAQAFMITFTKDV